MIIFDMEGDEWFNAVEVRKQMLHNVSAEGHKTEKRYVEFPWFNKDTIYHTNTATDNSASEFTIW